MKTRALYSAVVSKQTFVMLAALLFLPMAGVLAVPFNLGQAGPQNWSVLEIGNDNVSLANASNAGHITGNVGVAGSGIISDGGSLPITGNVDLGTSTGSSGLTGNVSGTITQNATSQALLTQAASDAKTASLAEGALAASGGGVGVTSISSGGTLTAGVYNLSSLVLQNATLTLSGTANSVFVFNISGNGAALVLNSAQILLSGGLTDSDVLFNITGSGNVQFSGSGDVLNGIILAPYAGNIQITPGSVDGEIIGGANIQIASGGSVTGVPVPDGGSTLILMGLAFTGLTVFARRFKPAKA